jgi:hypothetical protein
VSSSPSGARTWSARSATATARPAVMPVRWAALSWSASPRLVASPWFVLAMTSRCGRRRAECAVGTRRRGDAQGGP